MAGAMEMVDGGTEHDEKAVLLALLTGGKPYILITVEGADPETGVIVASLEHNDPENDVDAIRFVLENVAGTLRASEASVNS